MRKEDIIKEFEKHKDTVLSFPDCGPWGDYVLCRPGG